MEAFGETEDRPGSGQPRTSTRDPDALRPAIAAWLQRQLGAERLVRLETSSTAAGAGFSSETVLLDVEWVQRGSTSRGSYVLRLPPPADAFPLFPDYDLHRQVAVMRLVRSRTSVPVPAIEWWEPDSGVLGAPFFVMERVRGVTAPDIPPYIFGGWLADAPDDAQSRAELSLLSSLIGIHGLDASPEDLAFLDYDAPGPTPLRRHVAHQRAYYEWVRGGHRFELVEGVFSWLEEHWPRVEGASTLCWGDARVGNVLFDGFEPVAILDWENAAIGPREMDVGWLVFFHQYFQELASRNGRAGMPGFLDRDRVVDTYARLSGHALHDLDWYIVYAALRQALVSIRVSMRAVHFGERAAPDDPQDLILVRPFLERVLAGRTPPP